MTTVGQSRKDAHSLMKNSTLSATRPTNVGTWNVRTLYQAGKITQVVREFETYQLEILGLTEVRWTGSGKIKHGGATFLYSGPEAHHERGVGILLGKEATRALIAWNPVNERIITARLHTRHCKATVVVVYAPTEEAEDADKDEFYQQCQDVLNSIPSSDLILLMGDFNAQINGQKHNGITGPHGSAQNTNNNGERMLLLCNINGLCIGNTYFVHKTIHKKTWKSPEGETENEIDYICISKRWQSALKDVRVCRGADVGSDHHLVKGKVQLKLKKLGKHNPVKPFAIEKLKEVQTSTQFQLKLSNKFQALDKAGDYEEQWAMFREAVVSVAEEQLGRRRAKRSELWIQEHTWILIDERKKIKQAMQQALTSEASVQAREAYRVVDKAVKRSCRKDKSKWLEQKEAEAQEAANKNDTRTLYKIVKELTGGGRNSAVPVKGKDGNVITTSEEQHQRWIEHFKDVLNQPDPESPMDFGSEPKQESLQVDTGDISEDEVKRAVARLKNNKAAVADLITAELLKHGGPDTIKALTNLLNACWQYQKVPNDWRNGVIVKLPKKGNLADCNNWRGVTLLSVPGKVLCSVLLDRLRDVVDTRLREQQAGFRNGRSCNEQIFTLRNIIEQCLEKQQQLHINFVDFKKAFDSVHRKSLWRILEVYGIPPKYIKIFQDIYKNSSCCIKMQDTNSEYFQIATRVRQGCILSPFLFLIVIDFIMKKAVDNCRQGLRWQQHAQSQSQLIQWPCSVCKTNISRKGYSFKCNNCQLWVHKKCSGIINREYTNKWACPECIRKPCHQLLADLDFADDIALLAESREGLQELTDQMSHVANKLGLRMSNKKTKVMSLCQTEESQSQINIGMEAVEDVDSFVYLGSTLAVNGGTDDDVRRRIGKAAAVFRRLASIWRSSKISEKIKLRLYKSIVLPTALYACETWRITLAISKRLNAFHQRCLRRVLKVTYLDRITNHEVLRRSNSRGMQEILTERRMRFAGHVLRLPHQRHARQAITWKPFSGTRRRGRLRITWHKTFEEDLRSINLAMDSVNAEAANRGTWKLLTA